MNIELDKKICKNHPEIFRDRHGEKLKTAMYWGFECGDGWYTLINTACKLIDHHVKHRPDQQKWAKEHGYEVQPDIEPFIATQIKEKYGSLRFYHNGGDEVTAAYVEMAEALSHTTCELCGKPAKLQGGSWFRTLCDECVVEKSKPDIVSE